MLRRIVVTLVIAGVAAPFANLSAAQASVGLPMICASRNVNSLYWKQHCWAADAKGPVSLLREDRNLELLWCERRNIAGASQGLARAKPPGRDWRRLAARELDSNGRAKTSWKAPNSVTREWRFQWRSPYRDYVSPKLKGGHLRQSMRQQPSPLRVLGGVDPRGIEPLTSWLPAMRSTS